MHGVNICIGVLFCIACGGLSSIYFEINTLSLSLSVPPFVFYVYMFLTSGETVQHNTAQYSGFSFFFFFNEVVKIRLQACSV